MRHTRPSCKARLAALMMHGYRPDTKKTGHHMTVLQTTPHTIGLSSKRMVVLDALRRQRNVADYTGDDVDDSTAANCIAEANRFVDDVFEWRKTNKADLIPVK